MTPITSKAEAERAVDDLTELFAGLSALLQRETLLVRAGKVRGAAEIEPAKKDLAGRFYAASERIKAHAKFVMQAVPNRCTTPQSFRRRNCARCCKETWPCWRRRTQSPRASCGGCPASWLESRRHKSMARRAAPWRRVPSTAARSP